MRHVHDQSLLVGNQVDPPLYGSTNRIFISVPGIGPDLPSVHQKDGLLPSGSFVWRVGKVCHVGSCEGVDLVLLIFFSDVFGSVFMFS